MGVHVFPILTLPAGNSLPAELRGEPKNTGVVAYPFSIGSSRPRNRTRVSCIAGGCSPSEAGGNFQWQNRKGTGSPEPKRVVLCWGWIFRHPQCGKGCKNGGRLAVVKSQCFPCLNFIDSEQPPENLTLHWTCRWEDTEHSGRPISWDGHLHLSWP